MPISGKWLVANEAKNKHIFAKKKYVASSKTYFVSK